MKLPRIEDGEWFQVADKAHHFKMGCCDCGLVHDMEFRVVDGKIQIRAVRNNRATAQMRRFSRLYPR